MRWICTVMTAILLTTGCATMTETFEEKSHCGHSRMYCGTRVDALMIAAATDKNAGVLKVFWPIAIVDMPFSILVDTLLLPYTAYKDSLVEDSTTSIPPGVPLDPL